MGGKFSVDFLAPSGSGENTLVTCENGDYAADLEIAHARADARRRSATPLDAPEEVETPGRDDDRGARGVPRDRRQPRRRRRCPSSGTTVRSCSRSSEATTGSSEAKLFDALAGGSRPATEEEIQAAFGADGGSLGPVGFDGRGRRRRDAARGAVRRRGEPRRLASARGRGGARLRAAVRRPPRAARGGHAARTAADALRFQTAIEVGHIFNFGELLLGAARRDVPRRGRDREAAPRRQLRDRPRPGHGRGGRAAPRRARDPVAARRSRRTMCTWSHWRERRRSPSAPPRRSRRQGRTSCSTTATSGPGRSSPTPT